MASPGARLTSLKALDGFIEKWDARLIKGGAIQRSSRDGLLINRQTFEEAVANISARGVMNLAASGYVFRRSG